MPALRLFPVVALSSLLAAGGLFAAKVCETGPTPAPNVDAQGNLANTNSNITAKICINTKTGKFKAKASGQVENESGATQKFSNPDFPMAPAEYEKIKYRVKADGAAKLLITGRIDPNNLP